MSLYDNYNYNQQNDYNEEYSDDYNEEYSDDYNEEYSDDYNEEYSNDYNEEYSDDYNEEYSDYQYKYYNINNDYHYNHDYDVSDNYYNKYEQYLHLYSSDSELNIKMIDNIKNFLEVLICNVIEKLQGRLYRIGIPHDHPHYNETLNMFIFDSWANIDSDSNNMLHDAFDNLSNALYNNNCLSVIVSIEEIQNVYYSIFTTQIDKEEEAFLKRIESM